MYLGILSIIVDIQTLIFDLLELIAAEGIRMEFFSKQKIVIQVIIQWILSQLL